MDRIVLMEGLQIKDEGRRDSLVSLTPSIIGRELRESNIDWYLYSNRASVTPRVDRSRSRSRSPRMK